MIAEISIPVIPSGVAFAVLFVGLTFPYFAEDDPFWAVGVIIVAVISFFCAYGVLSFL